MRFVIRDPEIVSSGSSAYPPPFGGQKTQYVAVSLAE